MAAPAGYVDRHGASEITGRHRNTITDAARRGEILGAIQRAANAPWYFTVEGLRQWIGIRDSAA